MSKSKKRKIKKPKTSLGGYKRFLRDMDEVIRLMNLNVSIQSIPIPFRRRMYATKLNFTNPVAGNMHISSQELKLIKDRTLKSYYQPIQEAENSKLSIYQLHLINCYLNIMKEMQKKALDNSEYNEIEELASKFFEEFYSRYLINYFKIITQLSSPDFKYYGVYIRFAPVYKKNPKAEMLIDVYGELARKYYFKINGMSRPAFQLARPNAIETIQWIVINSEYLKGFYSGNKTQLKVYIQSHALKRLRERLDLLDKSSINYVIWKNTNNLNRFEVHRKYLLLPFELYDVKIGYFVANIIDDKVLFRTFLFITHNCTPEGDKLQKISGLGKQDISYWQIDRLSTFANIDEEKHPELIRLFKQSEMGELSQLKNKEFDINSMQDSSLDGLADYILQGRKERQNENSFELSFH